MYCIAKTHSNVARSVVTLINLFTKHKLLTVSWHEAILNLWNSIVISDVIAFHYLLLRSVLLRYQGNVLLTNHVRGLDGNLLRAGVVGLNHGCCVADVGVINGI